MNSASPTVLSPLSGKIAKPVASFPSAFFINEYAEKGVDVQRFFRGLNTVTLYECPETGYQFYTPPSLAGDKEFYATLGKFPWYYAPGRWEHKKAATLLKPQMHILEIGCGKGGFIEAASKAGYTCTGLDLNEDAVAEARARGLDVHADNLQDYADSHQGTYDAVLAFEVLEHLYDVRSFLCSAINLLRPGGKLILSMPNNDAFTYCFDAVQILNRPPHHMGLWTLHSLLSLGRLFPLRLESFEFEPLAHFKPQWIDALLRTRLIRKQGKFWKELPEDSWQLCTIPARELYPFLHGPVMLAMFERL